MPISLSWRFGANGHLTDGAVVDVMGEPIYFVSSLDRSLYALDRQGQSVWRFQAAGPIYVLTQLAADRVAIGDDTGDVTVLDTTGRMLWRHSLGTRVTALAEWQDGILAGGWDEKLTYFDLDGEVRWQAGLEGPVSELAVLQDLALVVTSGEGIEALDPTGESAWRFDAGVPVGGLEAIGEGAEALILVAGQDSAFQALDVHGSLLWRRSPGGQAQGTAVWHAADMLGDALPEIVLGTAGEEPILALMSNRGDLLWRSALPSSASAITAVDLNRDGDLEILTGLTSGELRIYDGRGTLHGKAHAGLPVWGLEPSYDGTALVRADVVAWHLAAGEGPSGGPWLPPPALAPLGLAEGVLRKPASGVQGAAVIAFLGDVAFGRSMESQLARFGPAYPWEGIGYVLRDADLAVVNLECVLTSQGEPLDKRYLIRAHPDWGQSLVEAGIDLVTVANNHQLDYGLPGLNETLDTVDALGIAAVGAGRSEDQAREPAIFTLNGLRVAIFGYAAARWNDSVDVPATDRVAWAVPALVSADVRAIRDNVDFVVVLLHAGTEYATEPSPDQVAVARAAVDAGADLVVGHHPHVTQTVERYGRGLVVYSLGDALFDIPRPAAMQGHLLRVAFARDGLTQAELWPFWIEDAIRPRFLQDGNGQLRVNHVFP